MIDDKSRYPQLTSNKMLQTLFMQHFNAADDRFPWTDHLVFTEVIPVGEASVDEDYPFSGELSELSRTDDAQRRRISMANPEFNLNVTNVLYDDDLAIPVQLFKKEKFGQIRRKITGWAARQRRFFYKESMKALEGGSGSTYGLCYDGNEFFDDSHADTGSRYTDAQDNKLATAYSPAYFAAAELAMRLFKDGNGDSAGVFGDTVVCCPTLYNQINRDIGSDWYADQKYATGGSSTGTEYVTRLQDNTYQGKFKVIEDKNTTSTTYWAILDTHEVDKPINIQEATEGGVDFTANERDDSSWVMDNKSYRYQIEWEGAWFYGDWRCAILGNA